MTRAREGRIVISHKRVCQDIAFNKMASGIWLQDFARTHIADKQTKFITVGRRLLDHETFFTPDRYEIVSRMGAHQVKKQNVHRRYIIHCGVESVRCLPIQIL
ncbi:hypothetical protein H4I96_10137 [Botrytis cinerea]